MPMLVEENLSKKDKVDQTIIDKHKETVSLYLKSVFKDATGLTEELDTEDKDLLNDIDLALLEDQSNIWEIIESDDYENVTLNSPGLSTCSEESPIQQDNSDPAARHIAPVLISIK